MFNTKAQGANTMYTNKIITNRWNNDTQVLVVSTPGGDHAPVELLVLSGLRVPKALVQMLVDFLKSEEVETTGGWLLFEVATGQSSIWLDFKDWGGQEGISRPFYGHYKKELEIELNA